MTLKKSQSSDPEADTLVLGLVGTDNDAKGQVSSQFRKLDLTVKKLQGRGA